MTTQSRLISLMNACFGIVCLGALNGCAAINNSASTSEDESTSGIAAAFVGGTVSSTSSTGKVAQVPNFREKSYFDLLKVRDAYAATSCPTFATSGTGCAVSGQSMNLTYSGCSFGGATAVWNGSQSLTLSGSTPPACGTWPATGFTGTLTRSFGSGTTRTSAAGTQVSLDTSANLANYTGTTVAGGGVVITFSSGQRTQIDITGINLSSTGRFSHTVSTPTALAINDTAAGKIVTGQVQVLHNLEKVTGTSTFNNVTFTAD